MPVYQVAGNRSLPCGVEQCAVQSSHAQSSAFYVRRFARTPYLWNRHRPWPSILTLFGLTSTTILRVARNLEYLSVISIENFISVRDFVDQSSTLIFLVLTVTFHAFCTCWYKELPFMNFRYRRRQRLLILGRYVQYGIRGKAE